MQVVIGLEERSPSADRDCLEERVSGDVIGVGMGFEHALDL
jgi:hypothetical protein